MTIKGISIVICTYNGKSRITSALDSISQQTTSFPVELLIVDNASTDGTAEFCSEYLNLKGLGWKVISESQPGLLHARIAGMKVSKYDWVLFCDDDNVLFPDFLNNAFEILEADNSIGVLGSLGVPEINGEKPDWFDQYAHSFAIGPQLQNSPLSNQLSHVYGACSIFKKKPILALLDKGFSPVMVDRKNEILLSGGDVEWCWLTQFSGFKIEYSSELKFFHQIPQSRLTWEYYLRLKEGIANGAGPLYSYQYFFQFPDHSGWQFQISYLKQLLKAKLVFFKNSLKLRSKPKLPAQKLALVILKTQMNSFSANKKDSYSHFLQLKKYFVY
ncbi:MAG: glycosyltransferase [Algoriphagus sp.]|nr:glycosyltransferase [Algoriphagus sp.]